MRDELLGYAASDDFDIVTRRSAPELSALLTSLGLSSIPPVTYERFGTAMIRVLGSTIELATARSESYAPESRKPQVEPASLEQDALRRDFTVNTLMRNLHTGELRDPLGSGLRDLGQRILRTPLNPESTFQDDPLRMLRAVRFRWKLGFEPAEGLYEAVRRCVKRLAIVSGERIRDEIVKMLLAPSAADALADLMALGIFDVVAPELVQMVGVEQGSYHHLDVWNHSLLVVRNAGSGDLALTLAALLHDVGKPATQFVDDAGQIRFFGHEAVGASLSAKILRRLRFPQREIDRVSILVKNHMRLGSSPEFTAAAARRLIRDLGEEVDRLLKLVEADADSLAPGVRRFDLDPIRSRIVEVQSITPRDELQSPLSGAEIMRIAGLEPGPEVGRMKAALTERVLDGVIEPGDKAAAEKVLREELMD